MRQNSQCPTENDHTNETWKQKRYNIIVNCVITVIMCVTVMFLFLE